MARTPVLQLRRPPRPSTAVSRASADASEAQVQMARAANVELFASDAYGKLLCAWISEATRTIHKIDVASEVDTAEAGLARWGHLRVNLLSALLYMASSVSPQDDAAQGRCVELLEKTEKHDADSSDDAAGGAATVCLNLLESHAARVDLSGVQHATNLLATLLCRPAIEPSSGDLRAARAAAILSQSSFSMPAMRMHRSPCRSPPPFES